MKQKKSQEIPLWAQTGHRKPVTRRELLAHGLIPFAGSILAPQALNLLFSSTASAQSTACATAVSGYAPFINLCLSGGAAMAGNFVPMNASGAPLASYNKMGLGNNQVPIEREFGGGTFAGSINNNGTSVLISKMLEGIRANADADTISRTSFVAVCVRSRDDSNENASNIGGLVAKAGLNGTHLPLLGSNSTTTGVGEMPAIVAPPTPLVVRSFRDIVNSLGYSASVGTQLNTAQKEKLANLVSKLSASQARKLANLEGGEPIKRLVECAGIKNTALVNQGVAAVDPVQNAAIAAVWGNLTSATNPASRDYVFGSMVYNAIMGNAGATGLEMGGYDYHNNTRTTGDARDREAGNTIGRILQSAKILGKPVFLYVTTDGSVTSPETEDRNAPWVSDRGSAGASFIFMYDPSRRPVVTSNQIGHFTDGQAADDKFVTGNDPSRAAQAVFANYLQFNKKLAEFNKIVGRNALETSALNQVVKVA